MRDRKMHMMAYLKTGPTATHPGGWRHPETDLKTFTFERYEHIARVLEAACFDGCFYRRHDSASTTSTRRAYQTYVEAGGPDQLPRSA
jgi:Rps23 Pro-64 3,4-dihydroxylase Tpa1-like proline 4-hydroxylase